MLCDFTVTLTIKSKQEPRMGLTKKETKKTTQNKNKTKKTAHKHNFSDHSVSGKLNIILQSILKTYVIFICIYCHFISHTCAPTSALSISWTNTHSLTLGTHEVYWKILRKERWEKAEVWIAEIGMRKKKSQETQKINGSRKDKPNIKAGADCVILTQRLPLLLVL